MQAPAAAGDRVRGRRARRRGAAGAARRRGRPRRRRVRGVPARDPLRLHDHRARAGHVPRVGAADRRRHVEPHPRRARRAEAPLPVPLDRAPRLRARARDPARARARGARRSWRARSRPRSRRCASSSSTSRPVSPRRSTGPTRSPRSAAPSIDEHAVDVTLGTILKYREDQERTRAHGVHDARASPRRRAVPDPAVDARPRRRRSTASRSASRACCAGAGLDVPVGATVDVRRGARARSASSTRDGRVLGRPGHAGAPARGRRPSTTARSRAWWDGTRRARRRHGRRRTRSIDRARRRRRDDDEPTTGRRRASGADDVVAVRYSPAEVLRQRDFAAYYSRDEFAEARRLMADLRLAGALRRRAGRRAEQPAPRPPRSAPHRAPRAARRRRADRPGVPRAVAHGPGGSCCSAT